MHRFLGPFLYVSSARVKCDIILEKQMFRIKHFEKNQSSFNMPNFERERKWSTKYNLKMNQLKVHHYLCVVVADELNEGEVDEAVEGRR